MGKPLPKVYVFDCCTQCCVTWCIVKSDHEQLSAGETNTLYVTTLTHHHVPSSDSGSLSQLGQTLPWGITLDSHHYGHLKSNESQQPQFALPTSLPLPQSSVLSPQEMLLLLYQLSNHLLLWRLILGLPELVCQQCSMPQILLCTFHDVVNHLHNEFVCWMGDLEAEIVLSRSRNVDFGLSETKQFQNITLFATASD